LYESGAHAVIPDDFIKVVLKSHEANDNSPIDMDRGLVLYPRPNYTGKMAREAFYLGMRFLNKGRRYAGLFDFKIVFNGKPVRHKPDIILPAVTQLPIEAVRSIHQGMDPTTIGGLDEQQLALACCVQAAFAEQEINWGEGIFQQRTYFGRNDMEQQILRESAPRDFQMVYIERCSAEAVMYGRDAQEVVEEVVKLVRTAKIGKNVKLPLTSAKQHKKKILPEFEPFLPRVSSDKPVKKWIQRHMKAAMKIVEIYDENLFHVE
jgi:hypothetical protein